nr:alpha/beta hydrolase [Lachnospiraceae bacterium]
LKANTAYALKDSFKESSAIIHVYVGEKENRVILRSADSICRMLPSCELHRMEGLRHGEFSINHVDQYANAIRQITRVG